MNKIILTGRICENLEIRETSTKNKVCEFELAVGSGKNQIDFIRCQCWNNLAEILVKYEDKGDLIAIVGNYRVQNYKTKEGKSKTYHFVLVHDIEFLAKKNKEKEAIENHTKTDFKEPFKIEEEDLPW